MKHIAFICSQPNYNISNRLSAIDSILYSILTMLSNNYKITVNGVDINNIHRSENTSYHNTSLLKKIIPQFIKEAYKIYKQKIVNEDIYNNIIQKPDLIFELLSRGSNVGYTLKKKYKVPYIIYYDSPITDQFKEIFGYTCPSYYKTEEIQALQNADAVITYSNALHKHAVNISKTHAQFYIYQTLDYSRLKTVNHHKTDDKFITIGFIGSFMHWHRVDLLIKAFNQLRKKYNNLKLLLVGSGQKYPQSLKSANQSPYKQDIIFTGFVDGDKLDNYKSMIDIGVMPGSNWYGIPTKVFEYGACFIPSLAPDTPTISEIFINEKELLLFENNNLQDLTLKLEKLIIDKKFRDTLAINLHHKIIQNYTPANATKFYINLFNKYF